MSDMNDGNVLAVVLARGGSKGIPGKNLKKVGGVSLIGRAIIAAKKARTVSTVLLSSDDPAILAEATNHGAETIVRPAPAVEPFIYCNPRRQVSERSLRRVMAIVRWDRPRVAGSVRRG